MRRHKLRFDFILLICLLLILLNSCVSHKELLSLQYSEGEGYPAAELITQQSKIKIQIDDILSISVFSFSPEAVVPFNPNNTITQGAESAIGIGYLVDKNGYIDFPVLGKIKLIGLSREEAKYKISKLLTNYIKEPTVEIRFLNFHVSIFGEVAAPGIYTFPDEKFTIIEALVMAGGLTPFANQKNILLIREDNNERKFGRIDMSSNQIFKSEYYYLQQNDVLYIEPLKEKTATVADSATKVISFISGLIGVISIIVTLGARVK